ncbi:MAG: alpha/beta hydrolase [Candidatus Eremiobacteraeota bacterium]|nr:alpha/beta hydrolase [Candidatus Eremiobacteraeota bacterium]
MAFAQRALGALVLALLASLPAYAAVPPPLPAVSATYDVGSLHVQQFGTGAQAVIFIPGLTCGPWEWSGEIARLSSKYTVYALTLPGFDGQPSVAAPLFPRVTADFWTLLDQKHIVKPFVIGHSLGGTTGFVLATQHPERLRGVIALDGLPIYPTDIFSTPDKIAAMADAAAAKMAAVPQADFAAYEQSTLPYLVTAPSDVAAIARLSGKSDPKAAAQWFKEDLELDARPDLIKANVPIVLLAPYDATLEGKYLPTADAKKAFYAGIIKNAPQASVVVIPNSRHFAMYDQPKATSDAIDAFLAAH